MGLNNLNSMEELVEFLKDIHYLKNMHIIDAFYKIDRMDFVPADFIHLAYQDMPLMIGKGQTISQPRVVAFMLEMLKPEKGNKILDVGSGSGWTTALLADIVGDNGMVYAIERIKTLKEFGENNVKKYGFNNVVFSHGDGSKGWPEYAPFDRILVSAAAKKINRNFLEQMNTGGRLVMPLEDIGGNIVVVRKVNDEEFRQEFFSGFSFVPLEEDR